MSRPFIISDTLAERLAFLGGASGWLMMSGANPEAFIVLAGAVAGIGALSGNALWKKITTQSPDTERAIARIRRAIKRDIEWEVFFEEIDHDTDLLNSADKLLSKYLLSCWPKPKTIALLSTSKAGLSEAVFQYVLQDLLRIREAHKIFENDTPKLFVELIVKKAIDCALNEKEYFETLEPHLLLHQLKLIGESNGILQKLHRSSYDTAECFQKIESNQNRMNDKLDAILEALNYNSKIEVPSSVSLDLRKNLLELIETAATKFEKEATESLMEEPPNLHRSLDILIEGAEYQAKITDFSSDNELKLLRKIVTIAFFIRPKAAVKAAEKIRRLAPDDLQNLYQLNAIQYRFGDYPQAMVYAIELLEAAKTKHDIKMWATAYSGLGNISLKTGFPREANGYFLKQLNLLTKKRYYKGLSHCYGNIGNALLTEAFSEDKENSDLLELSKAFYSLSLDISKSQNDEQRMIAVLGNLGNIELKIGNIDEAEVFFHQATDLAEKYKSTIQLFYGYHSKGVIFQLRSDTRNARLYYKLALRLCVQMNFNFGKALSYISLGSLSKDSMEKERACSEWRDALNILRKIGPEISIRNHISRMEELGCEC